MNVGKNGELDYCKDQKTHFTGAAARKWGAPKVMAAYCEMVAFTLEKGFTSRLMEQDKWRPVEFTPIRQYLTPRSRSDFDPAVADISDGNWDKENNFQVVNALTFLQMSNDKVRVVRAISGIPQVTKKSFSPATTLVDTATGADRLAMRFTVKATLAMEPVAGGDDKYKLPIVKDVTYWLIPNVDPAAKKDIPWLIDGWRLNEGTKIGPAKKL